MNNTLNEYNQKRNFEKTLEPEGKIESSIEELRFVVQHHLARTNHFDFRLEWNGVLLSWAVPKGPSYNTCDKRLAVMVEDHHLDYRNFEGIIPEGEYGAGVVMLWDEGYWEPYGNIEENLRDGMLKFFLKGFRLKGKWALVKLNKKDGSNSDNWLFLKEKDEYVSDIRNISDYATSIRTGRTMEQIERGQQENIIKNPFSSANVQLAKLEKTIPQGEDWLYELKYDGYRILSYVEGSSARLITRNNNDYSKQFYEISSSLVEWANNRALVLDGEVVVTDESGKTNFQALQNYIKNKASKNLTYIIFDILALEGKDLREKTLVERKQILEELMKGAPKNLYYSHHVKGSGKESFAAACEANMEGIVGKKAKSSYSGTRNGDWIKLKCDKRQEFIIGGYSISDKKTKGVSSLLLGIYEGEQFEYAGRAGTGISEKEMKMLESKFGELIRTETPFRILPKLRANEKIIWLEPRLLAEIKFTEWTKDKLLRQASYKGLREDKNPKDVKREIAEQVELEEEQIELKVKDTVNEGLKITNPSKIIFTEPDITKEQVIDYYKSVSHLMLPYVKNRILSIVRCPKGVAQTCFYKKHPMLGSKGIVTLPMLNEKQEMEEYFYIEEAFGILQEAQMGTLEFHIWGSSVDQLEKPDMMVFDLDPDEGMELSKVQKGVEDLKSILDELSLRSYLKTSGGKGYHVVVPLKPSASWEKFHDFAKQVAVVMENKWTDKYTSNVRKTNRKNKIFIDWIRNARGATSIAPYSLRARKGAKVSMPISWNELYTVAPDGINMMDALLRIEKEDPWQDFFLNDQMLK